MPNNHIIIRADGSKNIGMGHLSRSILLSRFLQKKYNYDVILITKFNEKSSLFLENKKIHFLNIENTISINNELLFLKNYILKFKTKLLILDVLENDVNYEFTDYLRSTGVKLLSITDDSYKRIINSDVIINANPCQKNGYYYSEVGKYYLGPSYFIMDESYSNSLPIKLKNKNKIIISLGGSDHNNLIFTLLDSINEIDDEFFVKIISSKSTGYQKKISSIINNFNFKIELKFDVDGIYNEWKGFDFAITAGGNTLFERIAFKLPGLTICQLERQNEIANKFQEVDLNYNLGLGVELDKEIIKQKIIFFSENLHLYSKNINQSNLIDGNGLSRVSNIIYNLIKN